MCRQTAPPSLPATQRRAGKQHSSPNLTTSKSCVRARRTEQRWRCVCGGGLDVHMYVRCWLAGWAERHIAIDVHRLVCVQCTSHYYGPWISCLLAGIASAAATQVCTALHAASRRRGPAQPARHDSTQNSSLHARTPKARQARVPSSLERRPSAGLTAAQVVVCDNPLSLPTAVPQGQ